MQLVHLICALMQLQVPRQTACHPDGTIFADGHEQRGPTNRSVLACLGICHLDGRHIVPLPLFDRATFAQKSIVASGAAPTPGLAVDDHDTAATHAREDTVEGQHPYTWRLW
jgi:hypothetical protein